MYKALGRVFIEYLFDNGVVLGFFGLHFGKSGGQIIPYIKGKPRIVINFEELFLSKRFEDFWFLYSSIRVLA